MNLKELELQRNVEATMAEFLKACAKALSDPSNIDDVQQLLLEEAMVVSAEATRLTRKLREAKREAKR